MSYSEMSDFSTDAWFYASLWRQIRTNFMASIPDVLGARGDIFTAVGAKDGAVVTPTAPFQVLVCDSSQSTGRRWAPLGVHVDTSYYGARIYDAPVNMQSDFYVFEPGIYLLFSFSNAIKVNDVEVFAAYDGGILLMDLALNDHVWGCGCIIRMCYMN